MIQLSPDYRIRPLDDLQWVLERRKQVSPSRIKQRGERSGEWMPFAYCRTKTGLETALSRLRCDYGVYLDASLFAHLPDRFPESVARETVD